MKLTYRKGKDKVGEYQVIRSNELINHIYSDAHNARLKAAMTSNAQTNISSHSSNDNEMFAMNIETILTKKTDEADILLAVIELMYINGLRISEILKISGQDISRRGYVHISGSKGSNDKWATTARYKSFWLNFRQLHLRIGDIYSRFWFYRQFKRLGISQSFSSTTKKAVTHAFRHNLIRDIGQDEEKMASTQKLIGHKNIKSTIYYAKKKK